MAASFQEFLLIGGQRARVLVQVFGGAELQWVHENAGHHEVDPLGSLGHQCHMAAVEVAHGRDEADTLAFAASAGDRSTQFTNGFDSVHALNPCSIPGKVTALTSFT
ncbi:hypothetical protein D3C76_1288530 [compost metagenome]